MGNEPIVVARDLTKRFDGKKEPALDRISAEICSGEITGLVGPDGAGKTTLIRLITGLLYTDKGEVTVAGYKSNAESEKLNEIIGYMPQRFGLYEDLSVMENVNLYADLRGITGKKRKARINRLLDFTTLKDFKNRLAGNLSGGMKQKLGLCCALIGDPKILLLDEPSVGVDPISRMELWNIVKELMEGGVAVLWSTSYLDEAEKCEKVILLNEGKKLYDGPPDRLLSAVKGRTYYISGIDEKKRRTFLMDMLKKEEVMDGIIQGSRLRVVIAKGKKKPPLETGQWNDVSPRFEDAFIDMLGGGPSGKSQLAEYINSKPKKDTPVIKAKGLTKRFGNFTAVNNISFTIKRGEIFGLLGPNGAGKSTTFKMLCGLLQPTEGEAYVTGLNLKTATSRARNNIGYMAQKFSLYGNLNILQNLKFFAGVYGLSRNEQKEKIDMMIDIFALKEYLKENSGTLPLGFKQRLALACSLMHEPDVLFLDEPTSGVDPVTRREFWNHINGMVNKGITIMITTHFMDEAEYCDRITLIYKGENIATGTPDDLKNEIRSNDLPNPTLEQAFIELINRIKK